MHIALFAVNGGYTHTNPAIRALGRELCEDGHAVLLIEHNLRLVAHVIKKYYTATDDQDDLISIGTIGLMKAANTFRTDKNIKLATYASRCIENEILMHLRSNKKHKDTASLYTPIGEDKEGNEIILITARDYQEFSAPYDLTRQFLKENDIPYDKLYVGIKQKGRFCKENKISE